MSSQQGEEQVPLLSDGNASEKEIGKETPKSENDRNRQRLLIISFFLMLAVGLGNKVFQKLQTIPMNNYPYFLSLLTTFIYIPLSFAYIIPMIIWGKAITKEQRAIPQYKFAIMGALDGVAGLMQSFAVNYIPSGTLVVLLYQSAIPISMIISKPLLKTKYAINNYVGAVVVVLGLLVVLIPKFLHPDSSGGAALPAWLIGVWCGVLVISCVPMTLSSVYKEKALGETEIDVVYLNGWVAVYQFAISILFAIPSAYATNLTIKELPQNIWGGMRCYAGKNTILTPTDKFPVDDCQQAPIFVTLYIGFNVFYNILIIMILKYGSSNILWLAMTIMVPGASFAFAIPGIPGRVTLGPADFVGLFVILLGLCIYRFWPVLWDLFQKIRGKKKEEGSIN